MSNWLRGAPGMVMPPIWPGLSASAGAGRVTGTARPATATSTTSNLVFDMAPSLLLRRTGGGAPANLQAERTSGPRRRSTRADQDPGGSPGGGGASGADAPAGGSAGGGEAGGGGGGAS